MLCAIDGLYPKFILYLLYSAACFSCDLTARTLNFATFCSAALCLYFFIFCADVPQQVTDGFSFPLHHNCLPLSHNLTKSSLVSSDFLKTNLARSKVVENFISNFIPAGIASLCIGYSIHVLTLCCVYVFESCFLATFITLTRIESNFFTVFVLGILLPPHLGFIIM